MKLFLFALMFTILTIAQNNDTLMAIETDEVGLLLLAFWAILIQEHKRQFTQWFDQHKSHFI